MRAAGKLAAVVPLRIALLLTGYSLSFTAVVGLIALVGIEVKNSILLVDFTNQLREKGMDLDEFVFDSSFATARGAGNLDRLEMDLSADLEAAAREAGKFVDLGNVQLSGGLTAELSAGLS